MATETVTKTVSDYIDDFTLQQNCAHSLTVLLEGVVEDSAMVSSRTINDPWHPAQQMYALIVSVRQQMALIEKTVFAMADVAKGVAHG